MTSAKPARSKRRHPRRAIYLDDLDALDPASLFRKQVEELRWFIAEHPRPLEEWTESDQQEFQRLAEHDFLLVGMAMAAPGTTDVTSEHPRRPFSHNDK